MVSSGSLGLILILRFAKSGIQPPYIPQRCPCAGGWLASSEEHLTQSVSPGGKHDARHTARRWCPPGCLWEPGTLYGSISAWAPLPEPLDSSVWGGAWEGVSLEFPRRVKWGQGICECEPHKRKGQRMDQRGGGGRQRSHYGSSWTCPPPPGCGLLNRSAQEATASSRRLSDRLSISKGKQADAERIFTRNPVAGHITLSFLPNSVQMPGWYAGISISFSQQARIIGRVSVLTCAS